jgi:hypothetical protein
MTIGLVAQHPVTTFTAPALNKQIIESSDLKTNDNALGTIISAHDADGTIHFQSSLLADRPAATVAGVGSKWITSDGRRIYYSDGSTWAEVDYLNKTDGGTVAGATTFGSTVTLTTAAAKIVGGATSLALRNAANDTDNVLISNAGVVTVRTRIAMAAAGSTSAANYGLTQATTGIYQDTNNKASACAGGADSFQWDNSASAGFTRMLLWDVTGAQFVRVKIGASGSGPSGSGRMFWTD